MSAIVLHRNCMVQRMSVSDLTRDGASVFLELMDGRAADVVYSDPPWNPGNEKYWRRFAGVSPPDAYDRLLDAWCACASLCGAHHVFVEQSAIYEHRALLVAAIARCPSWRLPLRAMWTVLYGSPKRPNVLMHYGHGPITTDPSGLAGERMTATVFDGMPWLIPGSLVADPCTGLGMTSRMADRYACDFVGTELNEARLARTIAWLRMAGYETKGLAR